MTATTSSTHHPELTRQEVLDLQPLPTSLAGEFRHHAGPGGAEIDDGKAVWSVESSANSSSTIATARVEPRRLVAVAAQRKGAACKPGELARLERRHVSQSTVHFSAVTNAQFSGVIDKKNR